MIMLLFEGGSKFHLLVWDDSAGEMYWEEEAAFNFEGQEETQLFACNTRKVWIYI